MFKKLCVKKFITCFVALFAILLIYLIPDSKVYKEENSYVKSI